MTDPELPVYASISADGALLIRVKVVPSATRDQLAGALGDRLKVRVKAPPENGKANDAVRELLARALGVPLNAVELALGAQSPLKSFLVRSRPTQWPSAMKR